MHPRSNSLAFATDPFEAELSQAAWPTMLLRIKVVAALLVVAVAVVLWRARRREGNAALATAANRAWLFAALMGIGGLAWFLVIAVMTQIGFSGNNRYLVLGDGARRHLRRRRLRLGGHRALHAGGTPAARARADRRAGAFAAMAGRPPRCWRACS